MSREIVREWHFWLASIMTGVFMAFAYDLLRLLRRLVRHARIIVDLEDILYWTACFGLSFTLLYYGNNGVIRFAAVLGAAVGMLFYALTAGRFFVKWCYFLIDQTLGRFFRFVRHFIVGRIHKLIRKLFSKIRLTCAEKRHKMKLYFQKAAKGRKEETKDGIKSNKGSKKQKRKKSKKTKEKNAAVPPCQE